MLDAESGEKIEIYIYASSPPRCHESDSVHVFEITEPGLFKVVMMAMDDGESAQLKLHPLDE